MLQKHSAEQRDASESGELLEQHSDHEAGETGKVEEGIVGLTAGK